MVGGYFYLDWFFLDGCFATSYAHWSYPNRIAPFGRILFAVALLNALRISSDFILASPFHTGLTQSPAQQFLLLGFFAFRILTIALASLVSYQPLSVFNSKLLTQPMIHSFYFVELLSRLRTKKPTLFAWAL